MAAQYGLIGFPLTHSFSPKWFSEKFTRDGIDATYKAYPLENIEAINDLLANYPLKGLNVTIPYKTQVLDFLDSLSPAAEKIGAVNCIDIRNGKRIGYNTDTIGFERSIIPLLTKHHTKALILGTGGAAQAVKYVLDILGIAHHTVSRYSSEGVLTYQDLNEELIAQYLLIINTTPLGMVPDIDATVDIPYHALTDKHLLYDLIYNPAETKFLKFAAKYGATTKNGYEMLIHQAQASWEIWDNGI